MKLLFGILLLLSIGFFSFMQWGGVLTGTSKNGQAVGDLNPDKIKLLDAPASRQLASSAVSPVQLPPSAAAVATPVAIPAPVTPAAALKPASTLCMEWGEFSGTDLKRATQELDEMKLGNHLTRRTVEYTSGYWVYVPPQKNKPAVNKKIEQLKALGVEDYFVLHEKPRWVNAISLGVFKTEDAAKKHMAALKKKGVYFAKLGKRKSKLKFIVFQLNQIDAELSSQLSKLHKEFENSELNTVACK